MCEDGEGHRVDLHDVEVVKPRQRGTPVSQLLGTTPTTDVVGAVPVLADPDGWSLVTVSDAGTVKRTELSEYADARVRSITAAGVKDGERIVAAVLVRDGDDLLVATDGSQVTRFPVDDVRAMGRTAGGVAGMNTGAARVVSVTVVPGGSDDGEVVTVGAGGAGKRTPLAEYSRVGRGAKGVLTGVDRTVWCGVATQVHLGTDEGWTVLRPVDAPTAGRSASGATVADPVRHPGVGEVDAAALAARTTA